MGQNTSSHTGGTSIHNLPPELLQHTSSYLDPIAQARMRRTGRFGLALPHVPVTTNADKMAYLNLMLKNDPELSAIFKKEQQYSMYDMVQVLSMPVYICFNTRKVSCLSEYKFSPSYSQYVNAGRKIYFWLSKRDQKMARDFYAIMRGEKFYNEEYTEMHGDPFKDFWDAMIDKMMGIDNSSDALDDMLKRKRKRKLRRIDDSDQDEESSDSDYAPKRRRY